MEENKKRTIAIRIESEDLRMKILFYMRKRGMPTNLIGSDLFRGVVFARVRHPEITLIDAIDNAVKACRFPGSRMSHIDGVFNLLEFVEVFTDINTSNINLSNLEDYKQSLDYIATTVDMVADFIKKDYLRTLSSSALSKLVWDYNVETRSADAVWMEILRDMCYQLLYNPDTTYESALKYASDKAESICDILVTKEELESKTESLRSAAGVNTCKELVNKLVDLAYIVNDENVEVAKS